MSESQQEMKPAAAGLKLFGNCVTNVSLLSLPLLEQVYKALTGHRIHHQHGRVDAVMVVAALGGVSYKTAREWYHSLETRGWGAVFNAVEAVGSPQEAVGRFGFWFGIHHPLKIEGPIVRDR